MNGVILGNFWWSRCKFCSVTVRVHLGSAEVTDRVLLITQDWKELQTWAWSHCAFLVKPHRLICSMTYLVQHVTLTWGQILTWLFKVTTYMFRRPLLRGSQWCSNFAAGFRSWKVVCKKTCLPKKLLFCRFWTPNAWTVDVISNLMAYQRKNSPRAIECFYPWLLTKIVCEKIAYFRRNMEVR